MPVKEVDPILINLFSSCLEIKTLGINVKGKSKKVKVTLSLYLTKYHTIKTYPVLN
jgi:hypothetical protein